ncbi:cytochrome c551 [Melghirimyces profundicolus]|uniref:Cytochrome c551 n=1 Tax=Melghirimyces profundicolus TaxID=1242148 RepID=A0A2T6C2N7_9BACL|nr:cytochrome c [Melghirimyces profundicolus]PTX62580.1 cytochrome c551 [Melghirimyces profundicolus]
MKKGWVAGMAMTFLLLSACAPPGGTKQGPSEESSPKALYSNNCASCHGQNLEGNAGPSLKNVGAEHSKEDIEQIIKNGKGQMPAQNQLSDAQRDKLAEWLAKKK